MTRNSGTVWKTSWNRKRGTPEVDEVDMAFFREFTTGSGDNVNRCQYETDETSKLGSSATFWFAMVGYRSNQVANAIPAFSVAAFTGIAGLGPASVDASGEVSGTSFDVSLDVNADNFVSACVVVVTPADAGARFTVYLDDQVYGYGTVETFESADSNLIMNAQSLPGALHGLCGGQGFTPTNAEVKQWFWDLKTNLSIQDIPGKTTHRYSAAEVYPLVPAVLPNLGTEPGQDMGLVSLSGTPAPTNVILPVRFPY